MHIIRNSLNLTAQTQVDAFRADHGVQLKRLETISRNFNAQEPFLLIYLFCQYFVIFLLIVYLEKFTIWDFQNFQIFIEKFEAIYLLSNFKCKLVKNAKKERIQPEHLPLLQLAPAGYNHTGIDAHFSGNWAAKRNRVFSVNRSQKSKRTLLSILSRILFSIFWHIMFYSNCQNRTVKS